MQPMAKKSSGALVTVQTPGLFLRTQALRSAVKKPPAMSRGFLCSEYLAYISQIGESRRADSNRCPAPATSDPSGVAGSCRGSQIPHIKAAFSAQACCVLHRIAFPVVSEWYQPAMVLQDNTPTTTTIAEGRYLRRLQLLQEILSFDLLTFTMAREDVLPI